MITAQMQFVLREQHGTSFCYTHAACMRAQTTYTKVFIADILGRDALCAVCKEALVAIPMLDCHVHTERHPFCGDITCPCYDDRERKQHYVEEPLLDGLITESEAARIFAGKQL